MLIYTVCLGLDGRIGGILYFLLRGIISGHRTDRWVILERGYKCECRHYIFKQEPAVIVLVPNLAG
jgi:hypothetical protein